METGTIIFILILLGLWHFIYDGIIAPSIRSTLRYRLFELRDEVRNVKIEKDKEFDVELFKMLDRYINNSIYHLSEFSIYGAILSYREVNSDTELKKEYNRKLKKFEECKIDEPKDINARMIAINFEAILINSGGWFPYLIAPSILIGLILLIMILVSGIAKAIRKKIREYIVVYSFTPGHQHNIDLHGGYTKFDLI